jgi:predicted DNA-binding transcriptional regulator YafY
MEAYDQPQRGNVSEDRATTETIRYAMLANPPKLLLFTYTDASGKVSRRRVEPYELRDGELFAHCLDREALRRFKVSHMTGIAHGQPFVPRQAIVIPL